MIPIIYYAHSMTIYNSSREQDELCRLQEHFPNGLIYNPNRPFIQQSKTPMQTCIHVVKDPTITGLAFSHDARKVSLGVYVEIRIAKERHIPIYIIDPHEIHLYHGVMSFTKKNKATNWAKV